MAALSTRGEQWFVGWHYNHLAFIELIRLTGDSNPSFPSPILTGVWNGAVCSLRTYYALKKSGGRNCLLINYCPAYYDITLVTDQVY